MHLPSGLCTLHVTGTSIGTGNDGFLYCTMYYTVYGTGTGNHHYRLQWSCGNVMFYTCLSFFPLGGVCLSVDTPRADTPVGRHPPSRGRQHPQGRHAPTLGRPPRLLQQSVSSLLECILVFYCVQPGPCDRDPGPVQCVLAIMVSSHYMGMELAPVQGTGAAQLETMGLGPYPCLGPGAVWTYH